MKKDYDIFVRKRDMPRYSGMNQITEWCYTKMPSGKERLEYKGKYIYSDLGYYPNDITGSITFFNPNYYYDIVILNIGKLPIAKNIYKKLMDYFEGKS